MAMNSFRSCLGIVNWHLLLICK